MAERNDLERESRERDRERESGWGRGEWDRQRRSEYDRERRGFFEGGYEGRESRNYPERGYQGGYEGPGQSGRAYEGRQYRGYPERPSDFGDRGDWGRQGGWGTFGNRPDWNREQNWSYGGGMGSYGGGAGTYGERGRFAGRGPKGYQRSDERIREDINERLTEHADIDATEIEVQVKSGEVTLSGTVDDRQSRRLAEDIAENVSGVREVHNQIRVQHQGSLLSGPETSGQRTTTGSTTKR